MPGKKSTSRIGVAFGILAVAALTLSVSADNPDWGECCTGGNCIVIDYSEACIDDTGVADHYCDNKYACCFDDCSCQMMYPSCCLDAGGVPYIDLNCKQVFCPCQGPGVDAQTDQDSTTPVEDDSPSTGGWSILVVGLLLLTVVPLVVARRRVRT